MVDLHRSLLSPVVPYGCAFHLAPLSLAGQAAEGGARDQHLLQRSALESVTEVFLPSPPSRIFGIQARVGRKGKKLSRDS